MTLIAKRVSNPSSTPTNFGLKLDELPSFRFACSSGLLPDPVRGIKQLREIGRLPRAIRQTRFMKRIIIDLDHTICVPAPGQDQASDPDAKYAKAAPVHGVIEQLRAYRRMGFEIVISTSRNMRTFNGDVEAIRSHSLPIIIEWLAEHDVPYDEVIVGKPWCGFDGFYVDDRAIRPSEFATLSYEQIRALIEPTPDA